MNIHIKSKTLIPIVNTSLHGQCFLFHLFWLKVVYTAVCSMQCRVYHTLQLQKHLSGGQWELLKFTLADEQAQLSTLNSLAQTGSCSAAMIEKLQTSTNL